MLRVTSENWTFHEIYLTAERPCGLEGLTHHWRFEKPFRNGKMFGSRLQTQTMVIDLLSQWYQGCSLWRSLLKFYHEDDNESSWQTKCQLSSVVLEILLMEEILHQLRLVVYPGFYRVSYIPEVLNRISEPSTVWYSSNISGAVDWWFGSQKDSLRIVVKQVSPESQTLTGHKQTTNLPRTVAEILVTTSWIFGWSPDDVVIR